MYRININFTGIYGTNVAQDYCLVGGNHKKLYGSAKKSVKIYRFISFALFHFIRNAMALK